MHYISTRGDAPTLNFEDTVLAGLARDGGLYVPETLPQFSTAEIAAMEGLSYPELAVRIMLPFVGDTLSEDELRALVKESYIPFRHTAIAPLKQLDQRHYLLELFHGPTLAFKDFALQFLGRLLDHFLTKRGAHATVLGATSGDTGSAAIAGCSGREHIDIFILHPEGRVSEVQRRQMTTILDANVHNIAIEGTFDDCQDMVKAAFRDTAFREKYHLTAVNSINWARILAQVVYYFYAALQLGAPARAVNFCVPTGNFGDIFAGYIARKMGLPTGKLIIATNQNDILTRCVKTGKYNAEGVHPSLSPSMDIQVSSNFERLLFDLHGRNGHTIRTMMDDFTTNKQLTLDTPALHGLRKDFDAGMADDTQTKDIIALLHRNTGELLDPHTAVGIAVAHQLADTVEGPIITLATAHPAKFPDAVKAATGIHPPLPMHLADLFERVEHYETLPNNVEAVQKFIAEKV